MGKYFGTDGFRGEANVTLNGLHAYKVGRFLGWYYGSELAGFPVPGHKTKVVIGKDTRLKISPGEFLRFGSRYIRPTLQEGGNA